MERFDLLPEWEQFSPLNRNKSTRAPKGGGLKKKNSSNDVGRSPLVNTFHNWKDPTYRRHLFTACCCEFIGTFLMVFLQIISAETIGPTFPNDALGHGLAAFMVVFIFIHISGAVVNPAISFSLWFSRRLDGLTMICYTIVQASGSLAAAGVALYCVHTVTAGLGLPQLGSNTTFWNGFVMMFILGFFLFFEFTFAHIHGRYFWYGNRYRFHFPGPEPPVFSALVAFAWYGGVEAAFVTTMGEGPNPSRWLGPAVVAGHFDNWIIYVLVPYLGVLVGAIVYKLYEWFLRPSRKRIESHHVRKTDLYQKRAQHTRSHSAPPPPMELNLFGDLGEGLAEIFE
jgi:glycerol uptake facilitator-like aquaporin